MTASEKLAIAAHGARYCHYDAGNGALITWGGGTMFHAYWVETGECAAAWSVDNQFGLPDGRWADMEWRTEAAMREIDRVMGDAFQRENDGSTYLGMYGV